MIAILVAIPLMMLNQRNKEKRIWNNGICAKSGKPWKSFDQDSQGGRGYTDGKNYCWISYKVDTLEHN